VIRQVAVAEDKAWRFWPVKEPVSVEVRDAVGLLGASNTATWRIERARAIARADDRPGYSCVQQRYTYLQPLLQPGQLDTITEELLDYAVAEELALLAYSPQLGGSYARPDRPLSAAYAHAGSLERLAVLREVADELGATPGQVVLAWLLARSQPPVIPIPGAGTVAQLDEILAATELTLDPGTITRLDLAGTSATAAVAG
jgi:aryl-alcohol dehydrogenase-like predicted oxidoreductase